MWCPVSPYRTPRGRLRWVIYLQGGGLCFTKGDCQSRTLTALGSSRYWEGQRTGTAVQKVDSATNPDFWDANQIYVPYCSGDLHTGTHLNTSDFTYHLYFSGHENLEGILFKIKADYPEFNNARDVLLSGDSAGGMGTFYNLDWLAEKVPWATVKGAPIAGWFFSGDASDQPLIPWSPPSTYPDWVDKKTGTSRAIIPFLVQLYKTYIHPNWCVSQSCSIADLSA